MKYQPSPKNKDSSFCVTAVDRLNRCVEETPNLKQSFYGRIYSQGYDLEGRRGDMLPFYLNKWKKAGRPGPVLEPMCGTGYFLIPFLEAEADIDGIDSSPYMLAECRKKCAEKGLKPSLHQQLIEEINLSRQYGFIFIPDRSFGHLYETALPHRPHPSLAAIAHKS